MSIADEYTYLVQSLSIQNGWSLSQEVCLNYATRVWQSAIVDRRLQEDFVRHYHADHELVEALGHPTHPEHRMYYEHVEQRCRRIIRKHHHYWTRDRALSEDDVCQMCMEKVILKIHTFQYRSSFPTWLTALIINEALQLHRRQHTQSRASVSESLDDHAGLASPQEQVHDEVLAHMRRLEFEQVLAARAGCPAVGGAARAQGPVAPAHRGARRPEYHMLPGIRRTARDAARLAGTAGSP